MRAAFFNPHFYIWSFFLFNLFGFSFTFKAENGLPHGLFYSMAGGYLFYVFVSFALRKKNAAPCNVVFLNKNINFINPTLLFASTLAVIAMLMKAGVSPLAYIQNLNYYRLNVNNDVGHLKIIINLFSLVTTAQLLRKRNKINIFYFMISCVFNIFFAYRFAMAFAVFSIYLHVLYMRKEGSFKFILYPILFVIAFSIFALWRDFNYGGNGESFLNYYDVTGLYDLLLLLSYHGLFAHFIIFYHFDDVLRYFSEYDNFHYGAEYVLEFLRTIKLGSLFDFGYTIVDRVNAHINGVSIETHLSGKSGGVVLGIAGSGFLAGGYTGIFVLTFGWCICVHAALNRYKAGAVNSLVLFPYLLMVFQSPETNIARIYFL